MSTVNSLSTPETVTSSSILVDATIPFEIVPVNKKLINELHAQLIPMISELASEFATYPVDKYVNNRSERQMIKMFQKALTEIARAFAREGELSESMIHTVGHMCNVSEQLFQMIRDQGGRSEYDRQEIKILDLANRAEKVCSETRDIVDQSIPSTTTLTIQVVGNLADLNTVGEKLRKRAIELVREAQKEHADENGWQTVTNGDGSVARYRAPLGSNARPVYPALDVEDPVQALQVLSNSKSSNNPNGLESMLNSFEM